MLYKNRTKDLLHYLNVKQIFQLVSIGPGLVTNRPLSVTHNHCYWKDRVLLTNFIWGSLRFLYNASLPVDSNVCTCTTKASAFSWPGRCCFYTFLICSKGSVSLILAHAMSVQARKESVQLKDEYIYHRCILWVFYIFAINYYY